VSEFVTSNGWDTRMVIDRRSAKSLALEHSELFGEYILTKSYKNCFQGDKKGPAPCPRARRGGQATRTGESGWVLCPHKKTAVVQGPLGLGRHNQTGANRRGGHLPLFWGQSIFHNLLFTRRRNLPQKYQYMSSKSTCPISKYNPSRTKQSAK